MDKPIVYFRSRHESGNIFFILSMVRSVMQKQRRITEYNELRDRVTSAGSYQKALEIIREKINLIDNDGEV